MVFSKDTKIYIKTGYTDMRKQINELAEIAQATMSEGPLSGAYLVVCGRNRHVIKLLSWDTTGFCLCQKRLEADSFPWPNVDEAPSEISRMQLKMVLQGIDVFVERKRLQYNKRGLSNACLYK